MARLLGVLCAAVVGCAVGFPTAPGPGYRLLQFSETNTTWVPMSYIEAITSVCPPTHTKRRHSLHPTLHVTPGVSLCLGKRGFSSNPLGYCLDSPEMAGTALLPLLSLICFGQTPFPRPP